MNPRFITGRIRAGLDKDAVLVPVHAVYTYYVVIRSYCGTGPTKGVYLSTMGLNDRGFTIQPALAPL